MVAAKYNFYFLCIHYVNHGVHCSITQKNISCYHWSPGPTYEKISIVGINQKIIYNMYVSKRIKKNITSKSF